jgi:hypothetical protein
LFGRFGLNPLHKKAKPPFPAKFRLRDTVLSAEQGSASGLNCKVFYLWGKEVDHSDLRVIIDVLKGKLVDNAPWGIVYMCFCQQYLLERESWHCVISYFD